MYNCVWAEGSLDADNRSHYGVATLVNNALDKAELGFVHRNGFAQLPDDARGAVVVVHGEHQARDAQRVVDNINRLGWSVVIVIADETGAFPTDWLRRDRSRVWVQMPVPGRHDWVHRKLICSHPHDAESFLCHYLGEMKARPYDWSFCGQVNNTNRRNCVAKLRNFSNGYLYESPRFWDGLPRNEYYRIMASSKIVMCPTGSATPDTMRVAEALEAGCVPIVEDKYPPSYPIRGVGTGLEGYWRYVLGETPPFPTITSWDELDGVYARVIENWEAYVSLIQSWWRGYKNRMTSWLEEDVHALAG